MTPNLLGTASYKLNSNLATFTANSPSGLQLGETILIACKFSSGTTQAVFTDQAGFTILYDHPTVSVGDMVLLGKVADATDVTNAGTANYYSFTLTAAIGAVGCTSFRASGITLNTPPDSDFQQGAALTSRTVPSMTSPGADYLAIWVATSNGGQSWTFSTGTEFADNTTGATTSMAVAYAVVGAGATSTQVCTASASANLTCFGVLLEPAPVSTETMVPTSGGAVTNLSTYTATSIDESPDADDGVWLTGTDPSPTAGLTNGPEYVDGPASSTAWSGGTAATWGTYANVIDTSETTNSTVTLASTNTDYQNWFTFAAGDWSDLPADAVITDFAVTVRLSIGTANRVQEHIAIASANGTLIGAEKNIADNTAAATTTLAAVTNTEFTVNGFSAMPTRAELVSGTFGVRLRQRRSNTSTITIYSIEATATYTGNGATTNTEVRAPMSNPAGTLTTGAGSGTIRALVRKLGSGSNPTAVITVRNAAGTSLATAVASTAVTNTTGQILSGPFDQSAVIADPTDVVVWVTATGASGGLVEVGAVEWAGQIVGGTPQNVSLTGVATEESTGALTKSVGGTTRTLAGLTTEETTGTLTKSVGASTRTLTGLATEETTGALTKSLGTTSRTLAGLTTEETTGALTKSVGGTSRTLTGVTSDESTGTLTPGVGGPQTVNLTGVASDETTGTLTRSVGGTSRTLTGVASEEVAGSIVPGGPQTVLLCAPDVPGEDYPQPDYPRTCGLTSDEQLGVLTATTDTYPLNDVFSDEIPGTLTRTVGATSRSLCTTDGATEDYPQEDYPQGCGVTSDSMVGALSATTPTIVPLNDLFTDEIPGTLTRTVGGTSRSLCTTDAATEDYPQEDFPQGCGVTSDSMVGALTVTLPNVIPLNDLFTDEIPGTLTRTVGGTTRALTGVGSDEQVGTLTIAAPGATTIPLTGVPSGETTGTLTRSVGPTSRALTGVPSGEIAGTLILPTSYIGTKATAVFTVAPKPVCVASVSGTAIAVYTLQAKPVCVATAVTAGAVWDVEDKPVAVLV